uniref:Uncharacterized protein n=1 Tax=Triticum urartu TaxID=4572 RepID=A0A8R7P681_TRIUA
MVSRWLISSRSLVYQCVLVCGLCDLCYQAVILSCDCIK